MALISITAVTLSNWGSKLNVVKPDKLKNKQKYCLFDVRLVTKPFWSTSKSLAQDNNNNNKRPPHIHKHKQHLANSNCEIGSKNTWMISAASGEEQKWWSTKSVLIAH